MSHVSLVNPFTIPNYYLYNAAIVNPNPTHTYTKHLQAYNTDYGIQHSESYKLTYSDAGTTNADKVYNWGYDIPYGRGLSSGN